MSGKSIIPFFSAREINSLDDFERFRNTKLFIRQKSLQIKDGMKQTPKLVELMRKCGYANFPKFREHRQEWDRLERKVPLVYLGAIGADLENVIQAVSLDQQEYDLALKIPLFPRFAVARLMACVYQDVEIPAGTAEDEAVELLKKISCEERCQYFINYPDLKTIWFENDGSVFYTYYRPSIRITRNWAFFSSNGSKYGQVRLG